MNILVTFASRHGSTRAIAETIAAELEGCGHRTVFLDVAHLTTLDSFDAVVCGSGVYLGRWLTPARDFLDRFQAELSSRPVWLFSSGQIGTQPVPEPQDVSSRRDTIRLIEHRCFAGRLDPHELGLGERLMTRMVGSAAGDYRNWDEIRSWARQIGMTLAAPAAAGLTSVPEPALA
jgi:menaquinone-dependent protoporphyrinogen oxidase